LLSFDKIFADPWQTFASRAYISLAINAEGVQIG